MAMFPDPNLVLKALRDQEVKPVLPVPDTGDDNVLPPDPGYMGKQPPYIFVSGKGQMPFPDNRDPRTDFANRWPQNLPPSGILNDLQPQPQMPPLMRRLPNG